MNNRYTMPPFSALVDCLGLIATFALGFMEGLPLS